MEKPTSITYSLAAIWGSLVLWTLLAVIDRQTGVMGAGEFMGTLMFYGFACIIPYKIGVGRNWARYVYAILTVLSFAIMAAGETGGLSKLTLVVSWVMLPVEVAILYGLFRGDSSGWFQEMAESRG